MIVGILLEASVLRGDVVNAATARHRVLMMVWRGGLRMLYLYGLSSWVLCRAANGREAAGLHDKLLVMEL